MTKRSNPFWRAPLPPLGALIVVTLAFYSWIAPPFKPAPLDNIALPVTAPATVDEVTNGLSIIRSGYAVLPVTITHENSAFLKSRQPWVVPVVETFVEEFELPENVEIEDEPPADVIRIEKPRLQLLGVLVDGSEPKALIRDLETDTETWVTQGQSYFGPWSVAEIQPKRVKFTTGTIELIVNFPE